MKREEQHIYLFRVVNEQWRFKVPLIDSFQNPGLPL